MAFRFLKSLLTRAGAEVGLGFRVEGSGFGCTGGARNTRLMGFRGLGFEGCWVSHGFFLAHVRFRAVALVKQRSSNFAGFEALDKVVR